MLRVLLNIFLYSVLFLVMFCMIFFLSEYRSRGFELMNRLSLGIIALILVLTMFSILDFRNKIFEAETIWSKNLQLIFYINLFLVLSLWTVTFLNIGVPELGVQNGLWCRDSFRNTGWGGSGWEERHYFHPILGIVGLIITLSTFCNIKYRLKRADFHKTLIELLPIIAVGILIFYHYNYITKPYFNG